MLEVGLTGGIATGKSCVDSWLVELGAHLVDTDRLARVVVEPGSVGLSRLVEAFGAGILGPDGALDRRGLRERVFRDQAGRQRLNAILHPLIRDLVRGELTRLAQADPEGVAVVDVPLLFEVGWQDAFDLTVLVYAPPEVQLARLMARDGVDDSSARAALAAQMPIEHKRQIANFVIDNSGSKEETRTQVERLWRELCARAASEHTDSNPSKRRS